MRPEHSPDSVLTLDVAPAALVKIIVAGVAMWLVVKVWPVIVLVAISLMLVATFEPWVKRLQKHIPRSWAIAGVMAVLATLVAALLTLWVPIIVEQSQALVAKAPQLARSIQETLAHYRVKMNMENQVAEYSARLIAEVPGLLQHATSVLVGVLAVVILTIYVLVEGPTLGNSLTRLLPRRRRMGVRRMVTEIAHQVGGYTRGLLVTALCAGLATFTILWLLEVPEAFALAALTTVSDAIPIIGILLALIPSTLIALTISPGKALVVAVAYLIYHQIEVNMIAPRVFGNILGLPLSIVVVCFLVGGQLMGILGAVLALPVAAAIPTIIKFVQEWQDADPDGDDLFMSTESMEIQITPPPAPPV